MGAALLQARLADIIPHVSVSSAGLDAMINWPADPFAQELMQEKGLTIANHRARQITNDLVTSAELILTMTNKQQKELGKTFPNACGKVYRLGMWGEYDVIDPYKRSRNVFEHALALIERGLDDWCKKIWNIPKD